MHNNKILISSLILFSFFANLPADWYLQYSGANYLYGIDFPPGQFNYGYACGANSTCLRTTNGGATWTSCSTQVAGEYRDLDFPVNYLTGFLVGDMGIVAITHNGGSIWLLGNVSVTVQLYCVQFPGQEQIGFIGGADGYFIITYDGGMSYNLIQVQPPYDIYDLHFINVEYGFAVGENGSIWVCYGTPDLDPVTSPTTESLFGVYLLEDGMTVWVVGANATCYKSTDAGQIWSRVVLPIPNNISLKAVYFPTPSIGYIVGSEGKILKTTDAGITWDTLTVAGAEDLEDIVFPAGPDDGWACGSGEAIYSTRAPGIEDMKSSPKSIVSLSSSPNPFRISTNIKFSYPTTNNASLKIYDCTGNLVKTLIVQRSQTSTIFWNGRNDAQQRVKPGVYMLEATTKDNFTQRLKLVLLN